MPPLISHHETETVAEIKALPFYKTFAASATAACVGEVGAQVPKACPGQPHGCGD